MTSTEPGTPNELVAENEALREENQRLKEENALLRKALYGTSSEKMEKPPETESQPATSSENQNEAIGRDREKPEGYESSEGQEENRVPEGGARPGRRRAPEHLPRERQEFHLSGNDLVCSCGCTLTEIGEDVSEQVTLEPVKHKVLERVKKKYACKGCGKTVRTAKAPPSILPGTTYGSPEFCAHMVTAKCHYGLPFYRQEMLLHEENIPIDRTTLARMAMNLGEACEPLWLRLKEELHKQDIAHADETTFQVLKEPGRKPETDSWLWQYRSVHRAEHPVVVFEYQMTRAGEHPRNFFEIDIPEPDIQFRLRYLHADAYAGYNGVKGMCRVGCWAHARRKFSDALSLMPEAMRPETIAQRVMELIQQLYAIEEKAKTLSAEERKNLRDAEAQPVLDQIKAILDHEVGNVAPKSATGKAIKYTLGQWEALTAYLLDGRLSIDNNISEREIKAFVIGRKNWLFADTQRGATSLAILYSLVRTAVANGLNPYKYLKHIFTELPKMTRADEVTDLLPWNLKSTLK